MSTASPPSSPDPLNRASIPPGWGDTIVLLGRILIGGIFVQSGFDKLMGLDGFGAGLAARGLPAALVPVLAPIGASVEFFGGLAIVFGLMTRCAALLMITFVIVATLISHRFWVFQGAERRAQTVQFAKNVAIIGGFLFLFVTGGGRYCLDRWWRSNKYFAIRSCRRAA